MNAPVLDPRAATAAAIARSQVRYAPFGGEIAPAPAAVKSLAHDRFGLDLTDAQVAAAIRRR